MTDYFALLDQPRQPWLDPEKLKQAFHARTLQGHPDAQPNDSSNSFAEVNEAYQVLRDPKRRLHHLLTLRGDAPPSGATQVPRELEELFPKIAGVLREAELAQTSIASAQSTLARSSAVAAATELQRRLNEMQSQVRAVEENALARLQSLRSGDAAELRGLYFLFSYLSRWIAELDERQLQLTLAIQSS